MVIVYGSDHLIAGRIAELRKVGRASGRNPDYWRGEVEKCNWVVVDEATYPNIVKAYREAGVEVKPLVEAVVKPKAESAKAAPTAKVEPAKEAATTALFGLE